MGRFNNGYKIYGGREWKKCCQKPMNKSNNNGAMCSHYYINEHPTEIN